MARPTISTFRDHIKVCAVAALALGVSMAIAQLPAFGQSIAPAYDAPVVAESLHPHPGATNPLLCVLWLEHYRGRLNEPVGPGGSDPITRVSGPSATTGTFGADKITCRITLTHASGAHESGWLSIRPVDLMQKSDDICNSLKRLNSTFERNYLFQ